MEAQAAFDLSGGNQEQDVSAGYSRQGDASSYHQNKDLLPPRRGEQVIHSHM
jgi:hypothetical protein